MNIPNLITVLRILLIPLLVIFLLEKKTNFALAVFVIAAVSDGVDGMIAKVFNQRTTLGAYLDPIADKLLIGASFITMAAMGLLPKWLAVLVISRDIIIIAGIFILFLNEKKVEMSPSIDSKLNTLLQLITICYFLLPAYTSAILFVKPYLVFFTAFITVFSGLHYIVIGFSLIGNIKKTAS